MSALLGSRAQDGRVRDPDVLVIGGGPGGSTAATALAQKGHNVLLLERERFPREHIGESLLPASMPFLDWLGVLPAVEEAGFLHKWGATMLWGREQRPWSWYFRETNKRWPHTYQVWRAKFDQILLENARANGVDAREGHRVTEVVFENGRAVGARFRAEDGVEQSAQAKFVVDASGQAALLGHARGLRRWDDFFRNMAVYAYYEDSERLPSPNENNLFIESYPDGWLWSIPLHTGWMSVGAVVDAARGQDGVRRLGLRRFLEKQIAAAPLTAGMLRDARLVHGPVAVKDWSYISDEVAGDGWILVGDAACFIDPLFSSGIHLAVMAGALAAAYVTTALKDEGLGRAGALFYRDQYYQEYGGFRDMAKLFYSTNRTMESYFWEARRIMGAQLGDDVSPREAFIRAIAGRPARGYERVVIESGEAPADFLNEVQVVESARGKREEQIAAMAQTQPGRQVLMDWRPRLAGGARLQKQPEVRDGELAWGYAISAPGQRLGTPVDGLVAAAAGLADGATAVGQMVARLTRDHPAEVERALLNALVELYVEGRITGPLA